MTRPALWLSTLFLICAFALGSASAGSRLQYAALADDAVMCNDGRTATTAGFVLAQVRTDRDSRSQTVAPQGPSASNQMKAPGPAPQKIAQGDCCGPVLGGCVSWCNKPGGCTGKGDCDTFKAN